VKNYVTGKSRSAPSRPWAFQYRSHPLGELNRVGSRVPVLARSRRRFFFGVRFPQGLSDQTGE
jgi:hypothetical protein